MTRVLLSFVFVVLVAHFALSWARVCCFCLSSVARAHLFVTSAGGFLVSCGCVAFLLSFLCMWHTGRCRGRVFLFVQGTTACYRLAAHLSAWMGGVSHRLVCFCMRRRFSRLHFQLKLMQIPCNNACCLYTHHRIPVFPVFASHANRQWTVGDGIAMFAD